MTSTTETPAPTSECPPWCTDEHDPSREILEHTSDLPSWIFQRVESGVFLKQYPGRHGVTMVIARGDQADSEFQIDDLTVADVLALAVRMMELVWPALDIGHMVNVERETGRSLETLLHVLEPLRPREGSEVLG